MLLGSVSKITRRFTRGKPTFHSLKLIKYSNWDKSERRGEFIRHVNDPRRENGPKKRQPWGMVGFLPFWPVRVCVCVVTAQPPSSPQMLECGVKKLLEADRFTPPIDRGRSLGGGVERGGGDICYYKLLKRSRDTLEMRLWSRLGSGTRNVHVCVKVATRVNEWFYLAMILDVLVIVRMRLVRVICPMSHLTEQKQVGRRAGRRALSHAGGGRLWSVTYVMTRQWSQRTFGGESGRGWGSTPPLLVNFRGKQPMMRSKGQRPGMTTAAL